MSHPYNSIRADKVEKKRVSHIAGKAAGGVSHGDEPQDRSLIKKMVKPQALRADGGAVKARADRPNRARGGSVKKAKGTTVNVIVAPSGGVEPQPNPTPAPAPPPAVNPPAPPVPMRPPGMPPSAGLPPPGAGPMPPMRAKGGRIDASRGATKTVHMDIKANDKANMNRKPVITKATGGAISSDLRKGKQMAPHLPGGSGGGKARLAKARMAK